MRVISLKNYQCAECFTPLEARFLENGRETSINEATHIKFFHYTDEFNSNCSQLKEIEIHPIGIFISEYIKP